MMVRRRGCPRRLESALLALACCLPPAAAQLLGGEFQVNTYTMGLQTKPVAAAAGMDNFVVVWESSLQDGSSFGVFGQRLTSTGIPVGSEFQINSYTTGRQGYPAVAATGAGNFVVVWESYLQDGSSAGVFGQRFNSTGDPVGSEFQVHTYTTSFQKQPAVASDDSGNFVVVWESGGQDGATYGVFGQRFNSVGSPVGSEFQVNTYTEDRQSKPAVASDGSGNFVVAWASRYQDGSYWGVFGQRFNSAGDPLGSEFQVNTYTTDAQREPAVTVDGSGNFTVVWESVGQDGASAGVFGRRFNSAGTALGSELQINTYTTSYQGIPTVTAYGSGNFVVAWASAYQDGLSSGIFGQRFNPLGPAGSEFQVNTDGADAQSLPELATDGSGNFVVVWHSNTGHPDYDGGVFGKRMTTTVFDHGFETNPPFWSDTTATMCAGFCPGQSPDGCFCDNLCLTFGDCCIDACTTCGTC